jgi:anti-sigma regulatory factor (Ser/Thr protein kinase)
MAASVEGDEVAPRCYEIDFDDVSVLRPLRRHIERLLPDADEDTLIDAELVCTELVTNAVEHAEGPRSARITLTGNHVTITVVDASPSAPLTPGTSRLGTHRGRGLTIIDAVAHRRVTRGATSKTVSATLVVP